MFEILSSTGSLKAPATYFKGEVAPEDLITPSDLSALVKFSRGSLISNTTPWLWIEEDGKTYYVSKKTLINSISWTVINNAGAVDGSKQIEINGKTYIVRLLTGGDADPATVAGGEYDKWILPLVKTTAQAASNAPYVWGDLENSTGNLIICKETSAATSTSYVQRSRADFKFDSKSSYSNTRGWRPVLELVQ